MRKRLIGWVYRVWCSTQGRLDGRQSRWHSVRRQWTSKHHLLLYLIYLSNWLSCNFSTGLTSICASSASTTRPSPAPWLIYACFLPYRTWSSTVPYVRDNWSHHSNSSGPSSSRWVRHGVLSYSSRLPLSAVFITHSIQHMIFGYRRLNTNPRVNRILLGLRRFLRRRLMWLFHHEIVLLR